MPAEVPSPNGDEISDVGLRQRRPGQGEVEEPLHSDTNGKDKEEITWGKTADGQGRLCVLDRWHELIVSVQGASDSLFRTHYRNYPTPLISHPSHFRFIGRSANPFLPTVKPSDYPLCLLPHLLCILEGMLRLGIRLGSTTTE